MLDTKTSVDRRILIPIILSLIITYIFIMIITYAASSAEYNWAWSRIYNDQLPYIGMIHMKIYHYSWISVFLFIVWGILLLYKKQCSLFSITIYFCIMESFGIIWILFTLFALYVKNQSFYM
jgi:hypothetical protein